MLNPERGAIKLLQVEGPDVTDSIGIEAFLEREERKNLELVGMHGHVAYSKACGAARRKFGRPAFDEWSLRDTKPAPEPKPEPIDTEIDEFLAEKERNHVALGCSPHSAVSLANRAARSKFGEERFGRWEHRPLKEAV